MLRAEPTAKAARHLRVGQRVRTPRPGQHVPTPTAVSLLRTGEEPDGGQPRSLTVALLPPGAPYRVGQRGSASRLRSVAPAATRKGRWRVRTRGPPPAVAVHERLLEEPLFMYSEPLPISPISPVAGRHRPAPKLPAVFVDEDVRRSVLTTQHRAAPSPVTSPSKKGSTLYADIVLAPDSCARKRGFDTSLQPCPCVFCTRGPSRTFWASERTSRATQLYDACSPVPRPATPSPSRQLRRSTANDDNGSFHSTF